MIKSFLFFEEGKERGRREEGGEKRRERTDCCALALRQITFECLDVGRRVG